MIRILVRKQLSELFQLYLIDRKTGKARSKTGILVGVVLAVALFGSLGFAFFGMAAGLGEELFGKDCDWLYFAVIGLLSIALGVFGSVFNTYAALYLPKDREFLSSLPIKTRDLILSRVLSVYAVGLLYTAWVWLPTIPAYYLLHGGSFVTLPFLLIAPLIIALFVTVLTCVLGLLVAAITSKTKGKSIVTVLFSLLFLGAYYVVYFNLTNFLTQITLHLEEVERIAETWLFYLYFLGRGCEGDGLSILLFIGISLALAALCLLILVKTYEKISFGTASVRKRTGKTGTADEKCRSPRSALLHREFRFFSSNPTWMLNGAMGLVFMPVLAVVAVIKRSELISAFAMIAAASPMLSRATPIFVFAAAGLLVSTCCITAATVSLEGKQLWILQSLPVKAAEILKAKERMSVLLVAPVAILTSAALSILLRLAPWDALLIAACVTVYAFLTADFGLMMNLLYPNLTWTNVTVVVKQGIPVAATLFGGMFLSFLLLGGGIALSALLPSFLALAVLAVILLIPTLLIRKWIFKKGADIFSSL